MHCLKISIKFILFRYYKYILQYFLFKILSIGYWLKLIETGNVEFDICNLSFNLLIRYYLIFK